MVVSAKTMKSGLLINCYFLQAWKRLLSAKLFLSLNAAETGAAVVFYD